MKKIVIVIGVCLLSIMSFFSGCINVAQVSIVSFDVEPGIINEGEYANLSWVVINASSVNINNGIGSVALTGHRLIQPTQTTTYTLTASNSNSSKHVNVTIYVRQHIQQKSQPTPNITCTVNNDTNRVIIASVDANVKWSDIAITTNPATTWQVQDTNNKGLAKIGTTATIIKNVAIGDNILIIDTVDNVTVTLKFIPTNEFLGNWTVNV